MAIDTIKSSAVLDGAIATADIADDAVTSAKLDTNIAIDGKLGIGDSTVLGNKVHIRTGGSATSVNASAGLVLEDDDNTRCDLQFMGPDGAFHSILFGDVSDDDIGKISYSHSGNNMRFNVNAAERMRLTADGLTFNGDTAAANALDDYEEGSWTPFYTSQHGNLTLNGNASNTSSMYTTQGGSYIKIGKKVICHMTLATNGVTSFGGSGNLWVAGLPFTNATTTASKPRGVNGCMAGRFNSFTPDQLVCNSNATTMQIRAGFESYPDINKLDVGGSGNRNVIEALIVFEIA